MMIFGVLIIVLAVMHFSRGGHGCCMGSSKNNALDILDEKFIKGELTEEEYKRKRNLLKG